MNRKRHAVGWRLLTVLAMAASIVRPASGAVLAEPPGKRYVYKTVDGRELSLYVSKPEAWSPEQKRPAVVFFHGGGWTGGAPGQFTEHASYLASRGMVCFQVEYRLLDKKRKEPPVVCTEDAADAMRWIRGRCSQFGIDPERIASAGGSAGGHLAAFLGCVDIPIARDSSVSAKSNAMLLFNPVYDNGPGGWGTSRVGELYPEFSPLHNLSADDPPSVVFLGTEDALIPVETGEKFRDTAVSLGIDSELHTYEGQAHGFFNTGRSGGVYYYKTVKAADEFLAKLGWLDGKPTLSPPNGFGKLEAEQGKQP